MGYKRLSELTFQSLSTSYPTSIIQQQIHLFTFFKPLHIPHPDHYFTMAPAIIGAFDDSTTSAAISSAPDAASGLASDTVFWLAVGGAIVFIGVGACLLGLALYQRYSSDKVQDDLEANASSTAPKKRVLSTRFSVLLSRIEAALNMHVSTCSNLKRSFEC